MLSLNTSCFLPIFHCGFYFLCFLEWGSSSGSGMIWTMVRDVDDTHWAHSRQKLLRKRWVSLFIPSWFYCYFYFPYDHSRSPEALCTSSCPWWPIRSLWAEPHSFQQSLLSVCLWPLWCLCWIATAFFLSFISKLDMNYSHKLILSKCCQRERVTVHCLFTMHQLLH